MTVVRGLRIAAIAVAFRIAFQLSQAATLAREGTTLPQVRWAVAVLTAFFLVSAVITERTQGPEMNARKDLMWGLATGGVAIVLS